MGTYHFVRDKRAARPAEALFGILPDPTAISLQAVLALGALTIVLLALAAYRNMLKPGLQEASRLHPYTPTPSSCKDASGAPRPMKRARSAASASSTSTLAQRLGASSFPSTNTTYKGLRNTGNTCFFNSTLQSLSSLTLYRKYLSTLIEEAERWDTPTPVIDSLLELIEQLATPGDRNLAINPVQLVRALQSLPSSSIRSLVSAHQQQDAHELFALLNEAVDAEAKAIQRERSSALDTEQAGFRALMAPSLPWNGRGAYADPAQIKSNLAPNGSADPFHPLALTQCVHNDPEALSVKADNTLMLSPFDALLAQRTICLDCGYCEAIRHFSASEISLSVPAFHVRTRTSEITGTSACSLQECLALWSDLEQVDWFCWSCTLRNTLQAVRNDIAAKNGSPAASTKQNGAANGTANGSLTPAKKKRLAQLRSKENKLMRIIQSGLSEDELKEASDEPASPWHNVFHNLQLRKTLSRLSTKQIMISRPPRILALHLNRSSYSASAWAPAKNNRHVLFPEYLDVGDFTLQGSISLDGTQTMNSRSAREDQTETLYRLAAIVVHYGSHSFGHYVAFKRVAEAYAGSDEVSEKGGSDGWLRISDESVTRATIQQVKQENPYMLFYELLPERSWQQQDVVQLSNQADYATLQKAIAGALAANGNTQSEAFKAPGSAGSSRASPAPSSLRVRARTVHRWSTPPVA